MSKAKIKNLLGKISAALANAANWIARGWRNASAGFRYALIYFLCVLVIAGLVWWQFSPADTLVFDPDAKAPEDLGEHNLGDENQPGEDLEQPYYSLAAFEQGKETLTLPLQGSILLGCGQAFSSTFHTVTAGIHISGTRGDPVYAAFQGRVSAVFQPGEYEAGAVWIDHGDFETRYTNMGFIEVEPGEIVSAHQRLGELGAKLQGSYAEDYLVFEVRDAQQEPLDPLRYVGLDR